jgi:CspA family cold shock protein
MTKKKYTGEVRWFNDAKGYGFVSVDGMRAKEAFAHFTQIRSDGFKTLMEGERVSFELRDEKSDNLVAENIEKQSKEKEFNVEKEGFV